MSYRNTSLSSSRISRRSFSKSVAVASAALATPALANVVSAQDVTEVVFWQFSTEDFAIAAWNSAIADFEAANPDVKVKMEIVPWADQHQKLVTGLASGSLPDVSMLGNNVVAEFQALGALLPVTDYYSAWSEEAGQDVTEDIWPGDKGYYFIDGDWWAAPVAEETRCVYFRKDLMEAAGLTPEVPDTFDAMREAAMAMTDGDVYGWGIPGGINYGTLQTFMSVYLGYGARLLNDEGMCGFDSQEFRDALTFYTNLYIEDKVAPADTPTYDNETLRQLFIDGRIGMYIEGPAAYTAITNAAPSFLEQVGIGQIPQGPVGRFGFLGGWPLVLWKTSKNPDAAFRWMRYATDPEGALAEIATAGGNIPGKRSLRDIEPWNAEPLNVFVEQMEIAVPYQYPDDAISQMGTLEVDAVQTAVQNVMLGQASVDEATLALVERVNEVLSR